MKEDKYVSFKRDAFESWQKESGLAERLPGQLKDAVVLRLQDRFATTALQSYADTVSNTIEVLEELEQVVPLELYELRDTFFEFAEAARSHVSRRTPR